MNTMPSKPRSPEAARLERDYLERLHQVLGRVPEAEAEEIEENVGDHIHAAIAELDTDEVGLAQLAAVLEELGSPESLFLEPTEAESKIPSSTPAVADSFDSIQGVEDDSKASTGEREFLDRLFAGFLIVTVGLFIPVIEFYFCAIIGYAVLWRILRKAPTPEIVDGNRWAAFSMLAAIAVFPAALLAIEDRDLAILSLPVGLAWAVFDIILYWMVFGGLSNWIEGKGLIALARKTRNLRLIYILTSLVFFMVMFLVGFLAGNRIDAWAIMMIGIASLPIGWVIGWFLILKPILLIRKNLG